MNAGWEISPFGWVLLVLLSGLVFYYVIIKLILPPKDDPQNFK